MCIYFNLILKQSRSDLFTDTCCRELLLNYKLWRPIVISLTFILRTPTHIRTRTCTHIHTRTYTHAYTHTYTHTYTHIHTHIHTHTHTHIHTHTYTHIHTHTHTSGGVIYIFPKFCPDSCYQGTCAERDRLPSAKRKWTIHSSGSKFAHGRHSTFREAEVECQKRTWTFREAEVDVP